MDPRHLFVDERLTGGCVYCGAAADTRDHVPSKVLLDEPYPPELPIVNACASCNAGFSLDEQYLSCFLECVICGTVDPVSVQRPNVRRILSESPALRCRIARSRRTDGAGNVLWEPEADRVQRIVAKLALGHASYELYPMREEPVEVAYVPLPTLSDLDLSAFENATSASLSTWPEIGTRAFLRACDVRPDRFERAGHWVTVQPGRYRYSVAEVEGVLVRMVLSEYLACEVLWQRA